MTFILIAVLEISRYEDFFTHPIQCERSQIWYTFMIFSEFLSKLIIFQDTQSKDKALQAMASMTSSQIVSSNALHAKLGLGGVEPVTGVKREINPQNVCSLFIYLIYVITILIFHISHSPVYLNYLACKVYTGELLFLLNSTIPLKNRYLLLMSGTHLRRKTSVNTSDASTNTSAIRSKR